MTLRLPLKPALVAAMRERVVLGWTYRRVAAALNVHYVTVWKYCRDIAPRRRVAVREGVPRGWTTFAAFRRKHGLGPNLLWHAHARGAFDATLSRVDGRLHYIAEELDLLAWLDTRAQ